MTKERRKFKLGFPLKFSRKDSELVITGNFSNSHSIKWEELDMFEIKSLDSDGFVLFEILSSKPIERTQRILPARMRLPSQVEAGINGYTLFHSSVPKSTAYGSTKSRYDYYKRKRDLSYYALIQRDGSDPIKIMLGSLLKQDSRMFQMARVIYQRYRRGQWFDRKRLSEHLDSPLTHRRLMKCMLDILVAEKFLVQTNALTPRKRKVEVFSKTKSLEEFMVDPRSYQKSTGVSVEQLPLTSDQ